LEVVPGSTEAREVHKDDPGAQDRGVPIDDDLTHERGQETSRVFPQPDAEARVVCGDSDAFVLVLGPVERLPDAPDAFGVGAVRRGRGSPGPGATESLAETVEQVGLGEGLVLRAPNQLASLLAEFVQAGSRVRGVVIDR